MTDKDAALNEYWSYYSKHGLRPLINAAGTTTGLGASICSDSVRAAVDDAMQHFVNMHELQAEASAVIAELTGAQAGCITACASSGITLTVAGCITGLDPAKIENLPLRAGPRNAVAIQQGHMCSYGAPVTQAIELAGAKIVPVGQVTAASDYQLEAALNADTAAAVYVVSHHAVQYGQIPLDRFCELCSKHDVPVIVDAAAQYDLRGFLTAGAALVIYSGHKFLGGPTSGIIAGRKDLVKAAYMQNMGIGRGMKVGKESIAGCLAALGQWRARKHKNERDAQRKTLALWAEALANIDGVKASSVQDPTGNPVDRLQVEIDEKVLGVSAAAAARSLREQEPAIIVRTHEADLGYFQLDPCNLVAGQAEIVAAAVASLMRNAASIKQTDADAHRVRNVSIEGFLKWPD